MIFLLVNSSLSPAAQAQEDTCSPNSATTDNRRTSREVGCQANNVDWKVCLLSKPSDGWLRAPVVLLDSLTSRLPLSDQMFHSNRQGEGNCFLQGWSHTYAVELAAEYHRHRKREKERNQSEVSDCATHTGSVCRLRLASSCFIDQCEQCCQPTHYHTGPRTNAHRTRIHSLPQGKQYHSLPSYQLFAWKLLPITGVTVKGNVNSCQMSVITTCNAKFLSLFVQNSRAANTPAMKCIFLYELCYMPVDANNFEGIKLDWMGKSCFGQGHLSM